jgi:hypothetical protein
VAKRQINVSKWQDYRGKNEGVLVYLNTSTRTRNPIRDILNEHKKGFQTEPNYETGTYNFFSCINSKLITSTFKNKRGYLFFGTSYQGTEESFLKKFLITGYMHIEKFLDVRKRHMREWMESGEQSQSPACLDFKECLGLHSNEMNFYALEDCFELTEAVMKSWGYSGRVAKHMKLTFSEKAVQTILEYFGQKQAATDDYIDEVDRLEADKDRILEEIRAQGAEDEDEEDDVW